MWRAFFAGLLGNALGYGVWRAAWLALPGLWASAGPEAGPGRQVGVLIMTVLLIAAPPGLIGAFSAWLAGRARLGVGLLSGLWALTLIRVLPAEVVFLGPVWFAPTVLILLSSALGAWLMELRAQVAEHIQRAH